MGPGATCYFCRSFRSTILCSFAFPSGRKLAVQLSFAENQEQNKVFVSISKLSNESNEEMPTNELSCG